MKSIVLATLLAFTSTAALADGFMCMNETGDLKIQVYNQTQPELGTRNAAIMILSNPTISAGRKTIATFKSTTGLLTSEGAHYVANVDLRFRDSSRSGEAVSATKLGNLDEIILDVDFQYNMPLLNAEMTSGTLTLVRRSGATLEEPVECERYLKGE